MRLLPAREFPLDEPGARASAALARDLRRRSVEEAPVQATSPTASRPPASSTTCRSSSSRWRRCSITCRQRRWRCTMTSPPRSTNSGAARTSRFRLMAAISTVRCCRPRAFPARRGILRPGPGLSAHRYRRRGRRGRRRSSRSSVEGLAALWFGKTVGGSASAAEERSRPHLG